MKKANLKSLWLMLAMLCVSVCASAYSFEVDGIYYNITSSTDKTCEVTYETTSYNSYSGKVTIPSTVTYNSTEYKVTSIGGSAFKKCSGLTEVNIPNSVNSIGGVAFYGCSALTEVNIPNSVNSIGGSAFNGCSALTEVNIPNSVNSIGYSAFSGCSALTEINIPNSVNSIGESAFYGCSSLPVVDNIRYADTYLVEAVDKSLSTYNIKEGTLFIGDRAFYECSALTEINIPNSVNSIGYSAFSGCANLTILNYNAKNAKVSTNTSALSFPYTITTLNIGNEVESLPSYFVCNCTNLTSVNIPNSVNSIGDRAFYECSGLTAINIPNSVNSIGSDAFYGCSNSTNVVINCKDEEDFAQYLSRNDIYSIFHTDNLSGKKHQICVDGKILTEIVIPNSVNSIGQYAFRDCSSLTEINIPNSVNSIGRGAFYKCSALTKINIPNSVNSIGNRAFYGVNLVEFTGAMPEISSTLDSKYVVVPAQYYSQYASACSSSTLLLPGGEDAIYFTSAPTLKEYKAAMQGKDKQKMVSVAFCCDGIDDYLDEEIMKNGMNPNCVFYVKAGSGISGDNIVEMKENKLSCEKLVLIDNYPTALPEMSIHEVQYVHNPSVWANGKSGWETLCLPFSPITIKASTSGYLSPIVLGGNGNFWLRKYVGSSSTSVFFTSTADGVMEANVPYLVAFPGESMGNGHLEGQTITFSAKDVTMSIAKDPEPIKKNAFVFKASYNTTADAAGYELNAEGSSFVKVASAGTNPFRGYFVNDEEGAEVKNLKIDFGAFNEETGIFEVEKDPQMQIHNGVCYDLSGRKLEGTPARKGIYIVNGKKVVRL